MSSLLCIVPSRGRPDNVAALLEAWESTSSGEASLLVAVDEDDAARERYLEAVRDVGFAWLEVGPPPTRPGMAEVLNRYARRYCNSYRYLGFMGDDHRPRTSNWDAALVDVLRPTTAGLAYGNDLVHGVNLPTAVVMSSVIPRALGGMVPGDLAHLYIDNAWLELGRATFLRYLPDVIIQHEHPIAGRASWDEGYARVNHPTVYEADLHRYRTWRATRFDEDVARIRAAAASAEAIS